MPRVVREQESWERTLRDQVKELCAGWSVKEAQVRARPNQGPQPRPA